MFNIGAGEMVLILVVALLVLGPTRLPELARGIGKFVREFRRQTSDVRNLVEREFYNIDSEVRSMELDQGHPKPIERLQAPTTEVPAQPPLQANAPQVQTVDTPPAEPPASPADLPGPKVS